MTILESLREEKGFKNLSKDELVDVIYAQCHDGLRRCLKCSLALYCPYDKYDFVNKLHGKEITKELINQFLDEDMPEED